MTNRYFKYFLVEHYNYYYTYELIVSPYCDIMGTIPSSVLLLRSIRKKSSNTLPVAGIEPKTLCSAVTLATTRSKRQSNSSNYIIHTFIQQFHLTFSQLGKLVLFSLPQKQIGACSYGCVINNCAVEMEVT
ncbi:hypothetical protein SFRURICE_009205 [Spodoptera frugiperda]|nr:hypothetical protein SFRURICE_009205 [Spodoptera frugiperda]